MDVIEVYKNLIERIRPEQNGAITISEFNRKSKIAELRLLDWLSGSPSGIEPPEPYLTAKNKDWLAKFIKEEKLNVTDGNVTLPEDYYLWESGYIIGSYKDTDDCGNEKNITGINTPITLLDSAAFEMRSTTHIKRLKPSYKKPIAERIGTALNVMPKDLGSIAIKYKRYPVYGEVKTKVDQVYNEETYDEATSIDYEWGEFAIDLLLYYLTQQYPIGTREKSLVEQNEVGGKLIRK